MKNNKVYFIANMSPQFAQIIPLYKKIGGYFITTHPFYEPFFKMNLRYGQGACKFVWSRNKLYKKVNGVLISQIATNSIPSNNKYTRIYIGHGISDKLYGLSGHIIHSNAFDYFFLTGPKDLFKLESSTDDKNEIRKKCLKVGDIRSDLIFNRTNNLELEKIKKRYSIPDDNRKTILYAPTWKWGNGTLKKCLPIFINKISNEYKLLIRPHFRDINQKEYKILKKRTYRDNIWYIDDPNLEVSSLFTLSDLLIGDTSSVDYYYLLTRKPIIKVKTYHEHKIQPPKEYDIFTASIIYDPDTDDINEIVEIALNNPKKDEINKLIDNCFYYNDGNTINRMIKIINAILSNDIDTINSYKFQ